MKINKVRQLFLDSIDYAMLAKSKGFSSQFIYSQNAFRIKREKEIIAYWDRKGILTLQDGRRLRCSFAGGIQYLTKHS